MKEPRLKLENLMALDVADAGVLKRNVVRLLARHPQGIKYGDFSGAFYRLHGHHPQLALHGYSSLKYLLTDMRKVVVLEKSSQATIIKLAVGAPLNRWLNKEKEMRSLMDEEAVLAAAVEPIVSILRDYPKGQDLRTLTKNLKKRGFDLGRFSQDMGYSDTVHCLLDMPRLRVTTFNGMGPQNSVVQLLSGSPSIPALPLSAASSLHKPLLSSASSKFPQPVMETKPVLAAVVVPILDILQDYPEGLSLQMLTKKLKKRGLDLEQFSRDIGYDDTVYCLLDTPGIRLIFRYGMVPQNCVVRLPSSSPGLPALPVTAGSSLHKPLSSSASGVSPQHLMETKLGGLTASAEVLAFLTNLLKTYPEGLQVKKLQELLLTMNGFDLEKFSIAQGYKDTLEYLEHRIPELKIKYYENRHCFVTQASQSSMTSKASTFPSYDSDWSDGKYRTLIRIMLGKKPASDSSTTSHSSASVSCDLDCSASKSKTRNQNVLGKKPASYSSVTSQSTAPVSCHSKCAASKSKTLKQSVLRKAASYSSVTSQSTASVSCHSKCAASKSKTLKQSVLRKAAPAEVLALLTNLINTYPLGVTIKELQEFLLRVMGFHLEKFSIAHGYRDALEFLEYQMPELQVESKGKRLNCVVKQGQGIKKKQKYQGSRKKMTKSPEDSLALLTNLLNTKSGMRVKKLQELLLALAGFDLEKFCIAQGYVDTLGFLEHQMPELKITYCGNRLECVVEKGQGKRKDQKRQGSQEKMTKTLEEVLALLTNLLKMHTSGLQVKKLQAFFLTVKGFDLQKFSMARGYKDTLEFLVYQMPELNFTYCGSRLNCVVKQGEARKEKRQWERKEQRKHQGSQEKTTKREGQRKEQKCQDSQEKMTKTLAEVLALLTKLLKKYMDSGLRVKKLEEFLLSRKGFDLQKFSLAQGYKDTLEFLEHQMPELNIKYCNSRPNCVVKQGEGKRKEQKKCQDSQEKSTRSQVSSTCRQLRYFSPSPVGC